MATYKPADRRKKQTQPPETYLGSVLFFKHIITAFVIVIILGLLVAVVYLWHKQNTALPGLEPLDILSPPEQGDGRGILVTPDNVNVIRNKERPTDTYFDTQMTNEWKFPTWDSPSETAFIKNPETNTRMFYFELRLDDTDELVYDSPYIPLGAYLNNFTLDKPLAKGVYPAVVTYYLVDDNFKPIPGGRLTIEVTVTVEN